MEVQPAKCGRDLLNQWIGECRLWGRTTNFRHLVETTKTIFAWIGLFYVVLMIHHLFCLWLDDRKVKRYLKLREENRLKEWN